MKTAIWFMPLAAVACLLAATGVAQASNIDVIGGTALHNADPTLTGSGIAAIQAEAPLTSNGDDFEVNPTSVVWSASSFTYINSTGQIASGTFPNSVGTESSHADTVAWDFYGNVSSESRSHRREQHDNYNANYYYNDVIALNRLPLSITAFG